MIGQLEPTLSTEGSRKNTDKAYDQAGCEIANAIYSFVLGDPDSSQPEFDFCKETSWTCACTVWLRLPKKGSNCTVKDEEEDEYKWRDECARILLCDLGPPWD